MRRALPLALLALLLLAGTAQASSYQVTGTTLTVTPAADQSVTLRAAPGGTYVIVASDSTWSGTGSYVSASGANLTVGAAITGVHVNDDLGTASAVVTGTGTGAPVAWDDHLTVQMTHAGSGVILTDDVGQTAPIDFGTNDVSLSAPNVTVAQTIAHAGMVVLTNTTRPVRIGEDITAGLIVAPSDPGVIVNPGTIRTLTATTVSITGPVVGGTGCAGVGPACRGAVGGNPQLLVIDGNLQAQGAWSGLGQLQVTGTARLGADVSSGPQTWQGEVRVAGTQALTLTASTVTTLKGIVPYTGPCGVEEVVLCGVHTPLAFTDLTVDGDWQVGGSVTPSNSITVTGLTTVFGSGANSTFGPTTAGPQDYRGGLDIALGRAATMSGSTITLAGMPEQTAVGGISAKSCDTGPLTVIGELRLTRAVECLGSLIVNGSSTLAADVSSQGYQSYLGPVTVALGSGTVRLRAGTGYAVAFPETSVTATWSAASGDVTGYVASVAPSGTTCSTTGALTCTFGAIGDANDLTFSVAAQRPAAAATASSTATPHRRVKHGSRTPLTSLVTAPKTKGRRAWSEQGDCTIRRRQLVAPQHDATCTVTLRIRRGGKVAWTGQSIVDVR